LPIRAAWRRQWLGGLAATAAAAAAVLPAHGAPSPAALTPQQTEFFESKIRPVLSRHCYKCHGSEGLKVKGGLLLDTRDGLLKGGDSGPAIVPGDPDKSLLIKAVRQADPDLQMPPKGEKLTDAQIADLVAWVKMGAPDPRTGPPGGAARAQAKADGKDHWAFQPVREPQVPAVAGLASRHPIDAFIGEKLAAAGLHPSAAADRRTLIRRATYDLIGLPPTPEETEAFVADPSPDAFARVVDRLLASPRYGERWGRHWLDVARYSDTKGDIRRQRDTPTYPFAWTYRDYVIRSFNEDKPYDRFILEQLAADKLPASARDKSMLAAMGFLTVGERFQNNANDIINDRIDVVTKGFLGLTVSCARCHDHMFDPIPTRDYYSLHGVFASSTEPDIMPIVGDPTRNPDYADYYKKRMALEKEVTGVEEKLRVGARKLDNRERQQLIRERIQVLSRVDALDLTHAGSPMRAMTLVDNPRPKDSPVFIRGEAENKGEVVPRRFLEILSGPNRPRFTLGSGRLELANAIASESNPLTARVMVNRLWQHHFGVGLVATPDDFGTMGAAPTHPELLDYLAGRFMQGGWSVKAMHRLIMTSATYQQASADNARHARVDPFNKLLWRANLRRLEFEPLRDSLLAFGGRLDTNMYGKPVPLASGTGRNRMIAVALEPSRRAIDIGYTTRRTVYGLVDRSDLPEVFNHFDFATPDLPTGKRHQTTVPQQALYLMNSPLVVEQARHLVERPDVKACRTDEDRIRRLYAILYQRPPRPEELQLGLEFVADAATPEDRPTPARPVAAAPGGRPDKVIPFRTDPGLKAKREAALAAAAARQAGARDVRPLNAWAEYAHALMLANETAFVN
jgi:mono/diheme cytochrome c family protein